MLADAALEQAAGTWLSHGDALSSVMMQVPSFGAFIRALLPIGQAGGHTLSYGVWVGFHPDDLQRAFAVWWEPAWTAVSPTLSSPGDACRPGVGGDDMTLYGFASLVFLAVGWKLLAMGAAACVLWAVFVLQTAWRDGGRAGADTWRRAGRLLAVAVGLTPFATYGSGLALSTFGLLDDGCESRGVKDLSQNTGSSGLWPLAAGRCTTPPVAPTSSPLSSTRWSSVRLSCSLPSWPP